MSALTVVSLSPAVVESQTPSLTNNRSELSIIVVETRRRSQVQTPTLASGMRFEVKFQVRRPSFIKFLTSSSSHSTEGQPVKRLANSETTSYKEIVTISRDDATRFFQFLITKSLHIKELFSTFIYVYPKVVIDVYYFFTTSYLIPFNSLSTS